MPMSEGMERLKTRRRDIATAEAAGEGDAVEGFMPAEPSEYESREEYKGFRIPRIDPNTGEPLSLPQRRAYKKAIDERENFRSKAARQLPRQVEDFKEDYIKGPVRRAKEVGKEMFKEAEPLSGVAKGVGEFAVDAALTVPRAKAAMYTDPEGSKEFMGAVASGDREARKQLATKASESMVEPAATMGDAALAKYAAEEGKYGEAALYGGMILLPGVLQLLGKSMSKGWLKSATAAGEEIPDEAAKKMTDLAKRVDEGKVTDDMQVRRELAGIEDAHKAEYMEMPRSLSQTRKEELEDFELEVRGYTGSDPDEYFPYGGGKPPGGERKSAFEPFPEYEPSPTGITSDSTKRKIEDAVSKVKETSERLGRKTPGGGGFKDQADQLIRELDELSFSGMQRSGLDMQPQSVLRKRLDDLRDRIEQAPPEVREEIFRRARMTSQGINPAPFTETIGQLGLVNDIRGGNPLVGKPPGGGGAARSATDANIFAGQRQDSYPEHERAILDFLTTDTAPETADAINYIEDLFKQGKLTKDEAMKEYRTIARQVMFDDAVDPEYYSNFSRPETMYDRAKSGGKPPGGTPGGGGDYPNLMDDLRSDLRNTDPGPLVDKDQARFTMDRIADLDRHVEAIQKTGKNAFGDTVDDPESVLRGLSDERTELAEKYYNNMLVRFDQHRTYGGVTDEDFGRLGGKTPGGGQAEVPGEYVESLRPDVDPGFRDPTDAEIQEMINQSRFGDPEELEMLKEDMRRMAELEQGAQVESGRVRRSRTPGAAGASGKIPEGTSRAERKGTRRERPKKKD